MGTKDITFSIFCKILLNTKLELNYVYFELKFCRIFMNYMNYLLLAQILKNVVFNQDIDY